jgi:hypothetical protein
LEKRFHAWYAKFKPASSEVVGVEDAEVGDIVSVGANLEVLTEKLDPPTKLQKSPVQPDLC